MQQRSWVPESLCCDEADPYDLRLWLPSRYADFVSPAFVLSQSGVPLPYGGATAKLEYRYRRSDVAPLATITTTPSASGSIVFYPAATMTIPGGVQFTTLRAVNQLIALPEVVFDMTVTWSTGLVGVLLGGRLCLRQGVTR